MESKTDLPSCDYIGIDENPRIALFTKEGQGDENTFYMFKTENINYIEGKNFREEGNTYTIHFKNGEKIQSKIECWKSFEDFVNNKWAKI